MADQPGVASPRRLSKLRRRFVASIPEFATKRQCCLGIIRHLGHERKVPGMIDNGTRILRARIEHAGPDSASTTAIALGGEHTTRPAQYFRGSSRVNSGNELILDPLEDAVIPHHGRTAPDTELIDS